MSLFPEATGLTQGHGGYAGHEGPEITEVARATEGPEITEVARATEGTEIEWRDRQDLHEAIG